MLDPSASTVLVIHTDDGIQSEILAVAIEDAGYKLISRYDAATSVEALKWVQPSCIVCDFDLRDASGESVARWVRKNKTDLALTPFILLASPTDTRTGVSRFEMGADVCMLKPYRAGEVVAQIGALIGMAQRLRAARLGLPRLEPSKHAGFSGELVQMSIAAVLTVLELERRTGLFEVTSDMGTVSLDVVGGRLLSGASNGSPLTPIGALRMMLSNKAGKFSFRPLMLRGSPHDALAISAALDAAMRFDRDSPPSPRRQSDSWTPPK